MCVLGSFCVIALSDTQPCPSTSDNICVTQGPTKMRAIFFTETRANAALVFLQLTAKSILHSFHHILMRTHSHFLTIFLRCGFFAKCVLRVKRCVVRVRRILSAFRKVCISPLVCVHFDTTSVSNFFAFASLPTQN